MIEITDEILNRYIDGELSTSEVKELNIILMKSEEIGKKLRALQVVHNELLKMPVKETSSDFTSLLMKKIIRRPERKGQKYFIFSVSSFFLLISLMIIGYLTSYIISYGSKSSETNSGFDTLVLYLESFVHSIKSVFSTGNVSLIGFIFSFGIIISAYFFFDSHRQAKAKLDKL
jgi:hypothetical protein